jgi:hypothetical protein
MKRAYLSHQRTSERRDAREHPVFAATYSRRIPMQEVIAVVFDGKKTAQKALDGLDEATYGDSLWVDDVAVISRNKLGFIRVNSTWAESDDAVAAGTGFGALTGALIGAAAGPGGALAGALGAGRSPGLSAYPSTSLSPTNAWKSSRAG